MFKFMIGKIAKMVSRNVNSAFFINLYREIYKEVYEIVQDEEEASAIVKELGIKGTRESCVRQESIFKIFPKDPKKVLDFLPTVIYQIIFGVKMDDYERSEEAVQNSDYPAIIYKLNRSSICGGFGTDQKYPMDFSKLAADDSKCAAGVVGMLQEVANYVLMVKGSPYRVNITERSCFNAGDNSMELYCHVVPAESFEVITEEEAEKMRKSSSVDFDLDKIEKILTKPLDAIKDELRKLIREKMNMTSEELFDHFRNYEDDVIRILGFIIIHGLNEPGRLIEQGTKNQTVAKIIGHSFNNMKDMTDIYVPREILADYRKLFIELMDGMAPVEMVDTFREMDTERFINLFYEGMEKGLKDLGVSFKELKTNIWEELDFDKVSESVPGSAKTSDEQDDEMKKRDAKIKMNLVQEVFMLISALLSLPSRVMFSAAHSSAKAIGDSGGEVFANVREHAEKIFEIAEKLK